MLTTYMESSPYEAGYSRLGKISSAGLKINVGAGDVAQLVEYFSN